MLTQQDLRAIGQLIDKKLATDISAIQTRLADLESGQIQKIDYFELRLLLRSVEKRIAAVEGKLTKVDQRLDNTATKDDLKNFATKDDLKSFATKDDLKSFATKDDLYRALRGVARKKDINRLDRKLTRKLKVITSYLDREILETQEKLNMLEQRIAAPIVS